MTRIAVRHVQKAWPKASGRRPKGVRLHLDRPVTNLVPMNVIDEMGQAIGLTRITTRSPGQTMVESDEAYGFRILQETYRTYKKCCGLTWSTDREENEQEHWAVSGDRRAFVFRSVSGWKFVVYNAQSGQTYAKGEHCNVETAKMICSLALSP